MSCNACGHRNAEDYAFCAKCGAAAAVDSEDDWKAVIGLKNRQKYLAQFHLFRSTGGFVTTWLYLSKDPSRGVISLCRCDPSIKRFMPAYCRGAPLQAARVVLRGHHGAASRRPFLGSTALAIVMTADAVIEDRDPDRERHRAMAAGMNDHGAKPINVLATLATSTP
jgi:hypothetical protein